MLVFVLILYFSAFLASEVSGHEIAVTGAAIAQVKPQYATIQITISSMSRKASEATEKTAKKHKRIVQALQDVEMLDIQTQTFRVEPKFNRDDRKKNAEFLGYRAEHNLLVSMRDIRLVGEVVDAAMKAGANNVGSVRFHAEVTDSLQEAVLAVAVSQARGRAEAIAAAAGGHLGELIELSTRDAAKAMRRDIPSSAMSYLRTGTVIMPGATNVHVVVLARWKFVQNADQ